jgi:hypothetical protein
VFALVVLGLTFAGFVATSVVGIEPVWAALIGTLVLAVRALARGRATVRGLVDAAAPLFCLFVLALGVVVAAVGADRLDGALDHLVPASTSLGALLAVAGVAALRGQLGLEPGVPHQQVAVEQRHLLGTDGRAVEGAGELREVVGQHAAERGEEAGARVARAADEVAARLELLRDEGGPAGQLGVRGAGGGEAFGRAPDELLPGRRRARGRSRGR